MKDFTIGLKQGIEHQISYPGSAFHIQEATDPVTLRFDNGDSVTREKTQGGEVNQFNRVELLSSVDQVVTVTISDGITIDGRAQIVSATINTTIEPSNTLSNPIDVSIAGVAKQLVPSNANRKEVLIHVPSDASHSIRVGGASVAVGAGLEVEIGSTLALSVESAVYAISMGAGSVPVSILDLARP